MTSRRKLLTGLGAGVAVATVAGLSGVGIKSVRKAGEREEFANAPVIATKTGEPPAAQGRGGDRYPNVDLANHNGETVKFYDDLLKGKQVMINFMPITADLNSPVLENLGRMAQALGPKLGRDIHMYTITSDPQADTPERIAEVAARLNLPEGWTFVTGDIAAINQIGSRLYKGHMAKHITGANKPKVNAHTHLVHYGNPDVGLWGALPALSEPTYAAVRASWVESGTRTARADGKLRRAGPRKLNGDYVGHSRIA